MSFRYSKLPADHIRLVELNPSGIFELSTHHMTKIPPFYALSYVWGQEMKQSMGQISCRSMDGGNEGQLSVTRNLFMALPYLHRRLNLPIWIDAVCIDQDSTTEKEVLVPKMGQIYGKASQVFVWLGPESDNSDLAMDVVSLISGDENNGQATLSSVGVTEHQVASVVSILTLGAGRSIDVTEAEFHRLGLPALSHPMWEALRNLYFKEWFSRVWTFQEVKLASEAIVLCGTKSARWNTFLDLGLRLARTQLLYGHLSNMKTNLDEFDYLMDDTSFLSLLHALRTRDCLKKEDRVYALLGLVSEMIRAEILIKYDDVNPDNYCLVYRSTGLLLLKVAGLDAVLRNASSSGKPTRIPSWCPDWSLPTTSRGVFSNAKAGHPMRAKAYNYVHPSDQSRILVNGACIDRIALVNDTYIWHWPNGGVTGEDGPAHKLLQWLDDCVSMVRRCGLGQNAERVCWETLCGDVPGHNPTSWVTFPPSLEVGFRAFRKRLDENRRCVPIADTSMSQEERVALVPLIAYLGHMWRGRVFFTTEQGRVGFADSGVRKGDLACIFFGQPQIYVLRQRWKSDEKPDSETTFVSRSYMHGAMLGEACASLAEGQRTVFVIS